MGQQFANLVDIHYRLLVGIVDGCLYLVFANFLSQLTGKLVVDGMTGTCGNDTALDGFTDECHIANDVEQFVACTFVLPYQWLVLNVTEFVGIAVLYAQFVCKPVKTLLCGLTLIDNNGIVHITAFDEVCLQQGLNVSYENESARSSNFLGEIIYFVECRKLRIDEFRLERTHGCDGEFVVGKDRNARTGLLVFHLNLLADDVKVFGGILFLDTDLHNLLYILDGRTVENGEFRTVDLYQTVVDAQSIKCRESVLYS